MTATSDPGVKTGDVLAGKYVVRTCIGRGGMGSVFLADQPALKRQVAIKVLSPELSGSVMHARRVRNEATAACRARSLHSVAVIECCALPAGGWALVMEYVPGRSLERVLATEAFSLDRVYRIFHQILCALAAVHASGLVHGDVKSDNFLVSSDGDDHVTMIDFGLARVAGSHAWLDLDSDVIAISGTPEYMAPEIASGDPAMPSSDVYAAGVVLYELLTGAPPFTGEHPMEILLRHTTDPVVPPSARRPDREIPTALDRLVLRALDKRPEMRFPDAAAFARELRAATTVSQRGISERFASSSPGDASAYDASQPPMRRFARGTTGGEDLVYPDTAFTCDEDTERARPPRESGAVVHGSTPYALFELYGVESDAFASQPRWLEAAPHGQSRLHLQELS